MTIRNISVFIKIFFRGYVKNNMAEKAIDLFNQIENPDEILVNALFNSCAQLETKEALAVAKKVAKEMPKSVYSNPYILTSLLDALMKCGDIADAQSLFAASTNKVLPMYGAMMKGNDFQDYKRIYQDFSSRLCEEQYGRKSD